MTSGVEARGDSAPADLGPNMDSSHASKATPSSASNRGPQEATPAQTLGAAGEGGETDASASAGAVARAPHDASTASAAGADSGPTLRTGMVAGAACATAGASSCSVGSPPFALRCDGKQWQQLRQCSEHESCVAGQCRRKLSACSEASQLVCVADANGVKTQLARCAPDLTMFEPIAPCAVDTPYCDGGQCVASVCVREPSPSLLRNGDFDTDVSSWEHGPEAMVNWLGEDATRCVGSGVLSIARTVGAPAEPRPSVRQCVSLTPPPGSQLQLHAWVRAQPTSGGAEPELVVRSWNAPDCSGAEVMGGSVGRVTMSDGAWHTYSIEVPVLPAARSAIVALELLDSPSAMLDHLSLVRP